MNLHTLFMGVAIAHASFVSAADPLPTDPAAPVPPVTYRSTLESYRPAAEEPLGAWRALNEDVAAIGGHIGIMRGAARKPAASGAAAPAAPPAPADAGHRH